MFRLLISGSRDWSDKLTITRELAVFAREHGQDVVLVSGACYKGADLICESVGKTFGWIIETHPAKWDKKPDGSYNRGAGFKRNELMVNLGADACLVFIKDGSAGASHTAGLAQKAEINTKVITA